MSGVNRVSVFHGDALTSHNVSRPPILLLMEGVGGSHPGCAKAQKAAGERESLALGFDWATST